MMSSTNRKYTAVCFNELYFDFFSSFFPFSFVLRVRLHNNNNIATVPEEDRAMDAGNMHRKSVEFRVWFLRYARGHTDRQTDVLITTLCSRIKSV